MAYPAKFVNFHGPSTWKSLHSMAFNYGTDPEKPSPEERKAALDLFGSLKYMLPCGACQKHYEAYLAKHPIDTSSRAALSRWVYDLHSDVNLRRGAPNLSWPEVVQMYTGYDAEKERTKATFSSVQRRMREMADPHFGRDAYIGSHGGGGNTELSMASGVGGMENALPFIAAGFGILALGGVGWAVYHHGPSVWGGGDDKTDENQKKK